jgi:predicted metal-binding membrane protein
VRVTLFTVVVFLSVAAWLLTYSSYHNMGRMMQVGVPISLGMAGSAGVTSFVIFTGMWLVMMVAMMLPSTYPTLLLHRTIFRKRTPTLHGGTLLFALGYFLVWTATGTLFYAAYLGIGQVRNTWPGSEPAVIRAAGVALIVSGLYQWTGLKRACLKHCQSPLHFISDHWYDGRSGSLRMGATHGFYCFGCCWGLMMILFVMGLMHLGWMAAVGALILLEKIVAHGKWISHAIGAVFVLTGAIIAIFPQVLSRLSSQVGL